MSEIQNAVITGVTISMADHGCLTFGLVLNGEGWGCTYGGVCIGHGYLGADHFDGSAKGLEAMMRIMDTVGVERWEDLDGKYIRVEINGWGDPITKIGHITRNKWFDLKKFFEWGEEDER